jgi:hypothetical protein
MTVVRRGRYGLSRSEMENGSSVSVIKTAQKVLVFTKKNGARSARYFSVTWYTHEAHAAALLGAFPKFR